MKAIVYHKYGSPEVLTLQEVPKPVPRDNEVLVRVHAASINSWDWDMVRGSPVFVRMWGLFNPKHNIPGADIAGRVEAVGTQVTKFKAGDEVFGDLCESGWGGFAEYVCANVNALAIKPSSMSFEDAAAIPQAGLMALQSVQDKEQVKPGKGILMNGAGGGVGTFVVQMAKSMGAEVTAVDNSEKLDVLRALGADHVIDYTQEDFLRNGKRYDLIIDVVSNRPLSHYKRSLNPGGVFLMIGGTLGAIINAMLLSRWVSDESFKLGMLAYKPNKGLDVMSTLFEEGKVAPVIDKVFPLAETPQAFQHFASGNFKGKVVIRIS